MKANKILMQEHLFPSLIGRCLGIGLLLVSALLCGCSDDDDNGGEQQTVLKEISAGKPDWTIDLTYNEPVPNWQAPDPSLFENWMIIMVRMQEELNPYISDDDMLALFVGDQLRAVSHPAKPADEHVDDDDATFFILKVMGNESSNQEIEATLKYWSAKLHQTFSINGKGRFIPENVKGVDTEFLPDIMLGSTKYPVTSWLRVGFVPEDYGFVHSDGDMLAVVIGNECRGYSHIYRNGYTDQHRIIVFSRQEGEEARLLYYNANTDRVYDTGKTFKTISENVTLSLN